jgi:hypothetical protein
MASFNIDTVKEKINSFVTKYPKLDGNYTFLFLSHIFNLLKNDWLLNWLFDGWIDWLIKYFMQRF